MNINLGDWPSWLGAIGTILAFGWAVFLYWGSIRDSRVTQARLLSVVGGAVPVGVLPGEDAKVESVAPSDLVEFKPNGKGGVQSVVKEGAVWARIHLVSTSSESFSDLKATLLLGDGSEVDFNLGQTDMAPHSEWERYCYYRQGEIRGGMRVRLEFRDASGRWWERVSGRPVQAMSRRETARRRELGDDRASGGWKKYPPGELP